MVITGEEQVGLDIYPKTPNLGIGIEDIIITTWSKKTLHQKHSNL